MKAIFLTALALAALVAHSSAAPSADDDYDYDFDSIELYPLTGCDVKTCNLDTASAPCQCPSRRLGTGMALADIPQFVMLTFDDAVNLPVETVLGNLFPDFPTRPSSSKKTPIVNKANSCPVRATFFVSHGETDYAMVNRLWKQGHEVAGHSVTHGYGHAAGIKDQPALRWAAEITAGRDLISTLGYVDPMDIRGFRAPNLQPGGQPMYDVMVETNMTYDSSQVSQSPVWPFRMDYALPSCWVPPCHEHAMTNMWQVPLVQMVGFDGKRCSMIDGCNLGESPKEVIKTLMGNYKRFAAARVPFPLFLHAPSLQKSQQLAQGFRAFLAILARKPEVHFATVSEVLGWIQKPVARSVFAQEQKRRCEAPKGAPCEPSKCGHTDYMKRSNWLTKCMGAPCPKDLTMQYLMSTMARKRGSKQ